MLSRGEEYRVETWKETGTAGEAWLQGNPLNVDTYKEEERDRWTVLVAR